MSNNEKKKDTTEKRTLLPTITCAIGMLIGGLSGAFGGGAVGDEQYVVALYAIGAIAGAVLGSLLGMRWHKIRNQSS
jgi:uncharacterized membrane protein YfcA